MVSTFIRDATVLGDSQQQKSVGVLKNKLVLLFVFFLYTCDRFEETQSDMQSERGKERESSQKRSAFPASHFGVKEDDISATDV